jgi:hypothetical protein
VHDVTVLQTVDSLYLPLYNHAPCHLVT